jgi:general secretion pathway protein I
MTRTRGFTLVEVLVALIIVAAGAGAVLAALNTAAGSATYLRERSFASWIAANRIAETRLQTTPAQNGKREGELDYAGQRWSWREEILDTEIPGLRRVEVSVRRTAAPVAPGAEPDWIVTLAGALGRDVARPNGSDPDWDPPAPQKPDGGKRPEGESPASPTPPGAAPAAGSGAPAAPAPAPGAPTPGVFVPPPPPGGSP